jgi:hypothetical protein
VPLSRGEEKAKELHEGAKLSEVGEVREVATQKGTEKSEDEKALRLSRK